MSLLEGILLILILLIVYGVIVLILERKNFFKKHNISFYGPALLIRTRKGIKLLERISSRKKFWRYIGNAGIILCIITMIWIVILLVENMWTVMSWTPEQQKNLPGIEFGLVIPGINPILPLDYVVYIILAIIIAVIVHEFSHGILTCVHNLKLKSLGVLYFIIPLGAFAEPDEENLRTTRISNRMRIYAAGPTANFIVAFITILIFSFIFLSGVQPIKGVQVIDIVENSPAEKANLTANSLITTINNTPIKDVSDFLKAMRHVKINQTITVTYYKNKRFYNTTITPTSKYLFTGNISDRNKSFIGVNITNSLTSLIDILKQPFTTNGFLLLYSLPFLSYLVGYNPIAYPYTEYYIIKGPLNWLPPSIFWGIVNLLFWIFWLNLVVALFNVLPMIPLDGGFIFTDIIRTLTSKLSLSEERKERIVRNISFITSILTLFIVLYPWIVKYL